MRILIAEDGQHVVEACRYLSRAGHDIVFAPLHTSFFRRLFFSKSYDEVAPAVTDDSPMEKIGTLRDIYDRFSCDVFFPFGFRLVTAYMDSVHRDGSLGMCTPYGSYESYWRLSDKFQLYETLEDTAISLPALYGHLEAGDDVSLDGDCFPVVVKRTKGVGIRENVRLARSEAEVEEFIRPRGRGDDTDEFVVQQYIPGHVFDVGGFAVDGELYYHVPQRRTVTYPLRGGVAAVNDVYDDPVLLDLASVVMETAEWTGPFQTEFRWNPADETYYLIEVNAKMWGSLPLSLRANPDLLDIALVSAVGRQPDRSLSYRRGLRYRWVCRQELRAMAHGSLRDWAGFFARFFENSCYDISIDDPMPDIYRLLASIFVILFQRHKLSEPLIDRDTHERLQGIDMCH